MKISKVLIIIAVAVLTTFLFSTVAFAGEWHKLGSKEQGNVGDPSAYDPVNYPFTGNQAPDAGEWKSEDNIPHSNLQTSSNNCRTCHAVHNADNVGKGLGYKVGGVEVEGTGQSFKLLRNETRSTECWFCHGAVGALSNPVKKPYGDMLDGLGNRISPKGQHTIGAKSIPDSTVTSGNSIFTDGLSCGNCHSVHGGWTLNNVANSGNLGTKILRRDPANNDNRLPGGAADGVGNVAAQGNGNEPITGSDAPITESQLLAAFCGDCHNKNVNWSTGGSGSEGDVIGVGGANEGTRPNKYAHPLGDVDGLIDVYGKLGRVEDPTTRTWIGSNGVLNDNGNTNPGDDVVGDSRLACDDCHKSRRQQKESEASDPANNGQLAITNYGKSKFPHQSVGHKLLGDRFTNTSTLLDGPTQRDPWDTSSDPVGDDSYTGNPDRPLPNLDAGVCRTCHGDVNGTFPGIGDPGDPGSF